jgi:hypothetical protein
MNAAPTVLDLVSDLFVEGTNVMVSNKKGIPLVRVGDGMKPKRPATTEGLHTFSPEELLAMTVPVVSVNGNVTGYQRVLDPAHARKIAAAMRAGKPMPEIQIALDGRGTFSIVDGQHRAVGAVMAHLPLVGIVRKLTKPEQHDLFYGQRLAKPVDRNVLVLGGKNVIDRYIQDAVTKNDHAWHGLVSANRKSQTAMTPYQAYQLLVRYIGNVEGQGAGIRVGALDARWDRGLADDLAALISCFGNGKTNPLAYKNTNLQAIGATAMWVFRRHPTVGGEHERWASHMPTFQFKDWVHVRTQTGMTDQLIVHWNKRLSGPRRVVKA